MKQSYFCIVILDTLTLYVYVTALLNAHYHKTILIIIKLILLLFCKLCEL